MFYQVKCLISVSILNVYARKIFVIKNWLCMDSFKNSLVPYVYWQMNNGIGITKVMSKCPNLLLTMSVDVLVSHSLHPCVSNRHTDDNDFGFKWITSCDSVRCNICHGLPDLPMSDRPTDDQPSTCRLLFHL